jgi:hypothetical protein
VVQEHAAALTARVAIVGAARIDHQEASTNHANHRPTLGS